MITQKINDKESLQEKLVRVNLGLNVQGILNLEKLDDLISNINNLCAKCENIGQICNICSVGESKTLIQSFDLPQNIISALKSYVVLNEDSTYNDEIEFNKNDVLLVQNAIESVCEDCSYIGKYCMDCKVHDIRRQVASLPLNGTEVLQNIREKKKSGGGCGTSCSTGCSTKKKQKT